MKEKIFNVIQIGDKSNKASRAFDIFIVVVILSNIAVMFMETFDKLAPYMGIMKTVEYVTIVIFCVEYALRIWTADLLYPNLTKGKARIKFLCSYDGVVDFLTIIPALVLTGFIVFRMLRVVRIFHLFRINARYDSFNVITSVLYEKRNQIFSSLFIIFVLMLASSICMYNVEHEAQPEVFQNAFSGMWWAVSTILTVGYGDIYPVTVLGKALAIVISFLGVGAVALPTGIVSAGFVTQYTRDQNEVNYKNMDISEIVEIVVDDNLTGKSIEILRSENFLNVYLILRDGLTVLPKENLTVLKNDIIVAKIER